MCISSRKAPVPLLESCAQMANGLFVSLALSTCLSLSSVSLSLSLSLWSQDYKKLKKRGKSMRPFVGVGCSMPSGGLVTVEGAASECETCALSLTSVTLDPEPSILQGLGFEPTTTLHFQDYMLTCKTPLQSHAMFPACETSALSQT